MSVKTPKKKMAEAAAAARANQPEQTGFQKTVQATFSKSRRNDAQPFEGVQSQWAKRLRGGASIISRGSLR
jgi:hypothetical protein